jgi:hypothetical protein
VGPNQAVALGPTQAGVLKTRVAQAAAKGAGPPYRTLWHPAADAERDASWPPEEKVAMLHAVEKL